MPPLLREVFFTLTFIHVFLHVADCVKVILGDRFIFPVNCEPGESGTLQRVFGHNHISEVATCHSGKWTVKMYKDRMMINSSKIGFNRTVYNDGGVYELNISKPKDPVQLEVVAALNVSVVEDESVILPCHVKTTGKAGLTVVWEKNERPLCVKNSRSDGCSGTPDRLSMSTDWFTHGDLSLTVARLQPGDRGDYFCYVQDEHGNPSGNPAAVRLAVSEKRAHQTTTPATPVNQTQSCSEQTEPWKIATLVVVFLLVVVALVVILCFWSHFKSGCAFRKCYKLVGSQHTSQPNEATTTV
ncbi:hypothetical protein CHARACLAT_031250 [Characodon lateralis]|uniref:Ig-like domain-containing protein n=1 Tax=Characodon lateralis TaxID=208331 RepID=A0ABU7D542_9TELE|nr:hypothetical protein [Characodon lateralis]